MNFINTQVGFVIDILVLTCRNQMVGFFVGFFVVVFAVTFSVCKCELSVQHVTPCCGSG